MYPRESNFSIVSALVAGVPNPLSDIASESSSSSISLPARSIKVNKRASLRREGGLDFSSFHVCSSIVEELGFDSSVPHPSGKLKFLGTTSLQPRDWYCCASLTKISPPKLAVLFCFSMVD